MTTRKVIRKGWKYVTVSGDAKTRGFQHGAQLSKELGQLLVALPVIVSRDFAVSLDTYIEKCVSLVKLEESEWREELEAICEGALSKGVVVTFDFLLAWNLYLSMFPFFKGHGSESQRCSAFIATGKATTNGQIVMAHNTHCHFILAPFSNIVMRVNPDKGFPFVMQTGPGLLCSTMDWFISRSGMIGCETTIAGYKRKPVFGTPYFCRIRECMQYGRSLDNYHRIMLKDNAGDHACGWMFGDIKTGEIMLLELGLHHHGCERTFNGVFYGSNGVQNDQLRERETAGSGTHDIKTSVGARGARLAFLLKERFYGRIDTNVAKRVIGDHGNECLGKDVPGNLTICKHSELAPHIPKHAPYTPSGAIDGKVVDSRMARKMRFLGIWGSSCGKRSFRPKTFTRKYPRYKKLEPFLPEFRREGWTQL